MVPRQHEPTPRPMRNEWDWMVTDAPRPPRTRGTGAAIGFLVVLAVAVPLAAAFVLVKLFFPDSPRATLPVFVAETREGTSTSPALLSPASPTSTGLAGPASVVVSPSQGTIGTLVTVDGQGWWPGEPVFIFLRSEQDRDGPGYSYAADVADELGVIATAFTFPNEARWVGQSWAEVTGRGTNSGMEARATFVLLTPTPTNTSPPPTPWPTWTHSATPEKDQPPTSTVQTPTPEPVFNDWKGEYFANRSLAGEPVLVRNDVAIYFRWGEGSPAPGLPADEFGVRWSRRWTFPEGYYRFTVAGDDGVRFWIDGLLLIDEWHDSPLQYYIIDVYLPPGERTLKLEYYENLGEAAVLLGWHETKPPTPTFTPSPTPTITNTPTPTSTPSPTPTITNTPTPTATHTPTPTITPSPTPTATHTPTPTTTTSPTPTTTNTPTPTSTPSPTPTLTPTLPPGPPPWLGEYYDNIRLAGQPVLVRSDEVLSFDWGTGSPDPAVPSDLFTARWRRDAWVPANTYGFSVDVDDGVRLWIDGVLLLDEWHESSGQQLTIHIYLAEGVHSFTVEYLEIEQYARILFSMEPLLDQKTGGRSHRP